MGFYVCLKVFAIGDMSAQTFRTAVSLRWNDEDYSSCSAGAVALDSAREWSLRLISSAYRP